MIKGFNFSSVAVVAGFVKMSATLSSAGTYSNFIVPACISDCIKWYFMSMCSDLMVVWILS